MLTTIKMRFKKFGFQYQEDGLKLEIENRSAVKAT
jgi:hypothetical protein